MEARLLHSTAARAAAGVVRADCDPAVSKSFRFALATLLGQKSRIAMCLA